jgi:hypothetical protein
LRGENERQPAAHAEPDDADLVARAPAQHLVDGPAHVAPGLLHLHRHHRLARFVGLSGSHLLAVVQVRGQRDEAGCRESVADVLNVVDQAPPLLDDDHSSATPALGSGQIASRR